MHNTIFLDIDGVINNANTDMEFGLTDDDVAKAIKILSKK